MAWQGIEGHDAIAARFAVAEAAGRVAGSYLFVGQPGVGKATFARALALALACEHPAEGLTACRQCASCIQALAGTHPDIDIVEKPPERTTIPLDALIGSPDQRLRTGFCWRLLLRPALARRKVECRPAHLVVRIRVVTFGQESAHSTGVARLGRFVQSTAAGISHIVCPSWRSRDRPLCRRPGRSQPSASMWR